MDIKPIKNVSDYEAVIEKIEMLFDAQPVLNLHEKLGIPAEALIQPCHAV